MKSVITLFVVLPLLGFAHEGGAGKPESGRAALEKKLHGAWEADDMDCVGDLTLLADGTFERQHYGPGNIKLAGTWEVRWHALPPTLVLTCKTSDDSDLVGKTLEVKVIQLDDESLTYQFPGYQPPGEPPNPGTHRYKRVKKAEPQKRDEVDKVGFQVPKLDQTEREAIVAAADQAMTKHFKVEKKKDAHNEINAAFWGDPIAKLKPIRVRNDHGHVAIVLSVKDGIEEGLYVFSPLSSQSATVGDRFAVTTQLSTDKDRRSLPYGPLYHYKLQPNAK